jgi:hypothetical protein
MYRKRLKVFKEKCYSVSEVDINGIIWFRVSFN